MVRREDINPELASQLVAAQFPRWAGLPVVPVAVSGWDNAMFRLGEDMSVRLPTEQRYAHQVDKEHRWLPVIRGRVPHQVPEPLAKGAPGEGYPWPWSIYRWLPGEPASSESIRQVERFAADLGRFLAALHRLDPAGGPPPSDRSVFRVGRLASRDEEVRTAVAALGDEIDTRGALGVWEAALEAQDVDAVWIHGDVKPDNLLVVDGRLSAVVDFGCVGVGDPAFDLEIAWEFFSAESRAAFREHLGLDNAVWARARGWLLRGAVVGLVAERGSDSPWAAWSRQVIREVLADHGDSK